MVEDQDLFLGLLADLKAEVERQDEIHPPGWPATRDGVRLGIATIEDETAESLEAWREERRGEGWPHTQVELLQTAAVAMRLLRSLREDEAKHKSVQSEREAIEEAGRGDF